ncbi:hypothetical protein N7532_010688 [Penicillium argentinense]|uniref:FAD-binding FR-type domain-containing protein n=1 Tax=Penicillium argentinense TaxID=1131581 RepID=A0A9W9EQ24_9EURO|nr:uncharacterized protein N7532_010688 [Penicillium argentinense]KAJ5085917.1 hypothetical protein N7532_010688 [Penicillium argentinense]
MSFSLNARHIQDMSAAATLEPHWGYADRALPCTSDAGTCAYLDADYSAHDRGMLYTGILWSVICAILLIWACWKHYDHSSTNSALFAPRLSGIYKVRRTLAALTHRYLLPDACRAIFGRTTRLQVLVLAALAGYLLIFSFVGIQYNTWVTPVSEMSDAYQTRSTIGPWSDRVGVLAYALTPLSVMLSSRESFLTLVTGLPYQTFNFLHRWLGYIIVVQGSLHTIMWCIVELRLYQPQPTTGIEWVTQTYIVWGIVAMILLLAIFFLSTPWGIRFTGYETFRKVHYVLAMVYIGACWGHWKQLKCFLWPSLIFWFIDRGARLVRTAILHYHPDQLDQSRVLGFKTAEASVTRFPESDNGDVIRLVLENPQDPWAIGQHYYLCFKQGSIWQSHPFTPLNAPVVSQGKVKHSYIVRAKKGETKRIADLAANGISKTPVILTGPYGESMTRALTPDTNIICVAGGTGITYVLPVLLELAQRSPSPDRKIQLIWAIRHSSNTEWVGEELAFLWKAEKALNLKIDIFTTRDSTVKGPSSSAEDQSGISTPDLDEKAVNISPACVSSASGICDCSSCTPGENLSFSSDCKKKHPCLHKLIPDFLDMNIRGPTTVFASGPGGMISDLRSIVASCNSGSKVWHGHEKFDVSLVCDDRLER